MSKTHNVKLGDRLWILSQKYYGTPAKWRKIQKANSQLQGRKAASDGSPLIYPGDILIIPDETENQIKSPKTIDTNSENEVTIKIEGQKFSFFSDWTLTQEIDSFDTFSFNAPFDPSQSSYRQYFLPFSYKSCEIYYGSNIQFTGILLASQSQSSPDSKTINLSGYPTCGILNDVMLSISSYPKEFNDQDIQQIANDLLSDFGISTDFQGPAGNSFKKVALEPTQQILGFLIDLASQRKLLISNNSSGDLLFWKANTTGNTVASFIEGETPFISCVPNFNPQQFYSHITGIINAKSGKVSEKYTVENNFLIQHGITRPYNFILSDCKKSEIQDAVKHKAGQMFGDAMQWQLTVWGHKNKNGELYQKNTLVSVESPGSMIYSSFKFLIKRVTFQRSYTGGDTTILDLVLPESYNGEIPTSFPFEEQPLILTLRG